MTQWSSVRFMCIAAGGLVLAACGEYGVYEQARVDSAGAADAERSGKAGQTLANAAPTIDSFTATLLTAPDKMRLSWSTTGAARAYIFGASDAAGLVRIGFVPVNGTKDVVTGWGIRTFVLGAQESSGVWRYKSVSTPMVSPPTPVTITSTNPKVINYFRSPNVNSPLPDHTITWNKNGASVVKMRRCAGDSCVNLPDATGTSYVGRGNDLASVNADGSFSGLLAPSGQGEVLYELTACTTRPDSTLFCGESAKAFVRVLPSQATSTWRAYRNHPVWLGHTLSWQANGGNWFYVDAPTLGVNNLLTSSTSYEFTAAQLNNAGPGLHSIKLKSCKWYGGSTFDCAANHAVKAPSAGTVTNLVTVGTEVWPTGTAFPVPVAKLNGVDQFTPRGGRVVSTCGCEGQSVAAGTLLATIETYDYSLVQLQLGGGQTWITRSWTQDFNSAESEYLWGSKLTDVRTGGIMSVNGTSILPNGDIYALGEFTTSAVFVSGDTPDIRPLPFLHKLNRAGTFFDPVRPFALSGQQSHISNSQDSFRDASGKIWSTQGWTGGYAPLHNHSRVYRFDPAATDSDLTLQDDRFCSYNVPGDYNDVMGVTHGGGRTWILESGWGGGSPARLTWFNPSEPAFTNCAAQNTLDYGTADHPISYPPGPAFSPGYCVPPATTNCFNTVELPDALGAPGHLVYDAAENAVWASTYMFGGPSSVGRYDVSAAQWSVYPLPAQVHHRAPWNVHSWGGSCTWKISVFGNYLYINDHTDGDIIRFDKTYAPRTNCTNLENEVQQVTVDATSGTWTLTFLGQITSTIQSEATAATVQSRLEALSNIDVGDVSVTGGAGGPYTVTFEGRYAAKDAAQLLAQDVSLSGGARSIAVTTTRQGGRNPCMSEVHLPSWWTWQSIGRGTKLYWTATGPGGGGLKDSGIITQPYVNDGSMFGYIDLNSWGAITTYTGLETLVAPERANVAHAVYSWFDVDQSSGKIAIGQHARGQWLRLVP
jgi:hypothetical protein